MYAWGTKLIYSGIFFFINKLCIYLTVRKNMIIRAAFRFMHQDWVIQFPEYWNLFRLEDESQIIQV